MGDLPKQLTRWCWGGMCIGSFVAYTMEFSYDQDQNANEHRGDGGFITLYIFILIFCIVGLVGAIVDNLIVAIVFLVVWTPLIVIDAVYLSKFYAFVHGQIAGSLGMMYAVAGGGGGGK